MNKKGFTLIELITTFALASVLIILLINIIIMIKNIYSKNDIKSELLIEQSNFSNLINQKLQSDFLSSYTPCSESDFCYNFSFIDGSSSMLVVSKEYIKFGSYVYKLKEGTTVENPTIKIIDVDVSSTIDNNSFLVVKIPIKHKLYSKEDFGINVVYQYNSNLITL